MALFDNFDWGGLVTSIAGGIPAVVASAVGAHQIGKANSEAAGIAQQAGAQNTELVREAINRSDQLNAPAIAHFRSVMGTDPSVMTPGQKIAIEDTQRGLNNKNLLGTVGGRAFSRIHADTTGRMRANAVKENTDRVDAAGRTVANIANQQGNLMMNQTNALTQNNNNVANAVGNSGMSTAAADADTYGQIANMFANVVKDQDRESRYREYKDARA